MTPEPQVSPTGTDARRVGDSVLRDAAAALRERADRRWVEISDRVVREAMKATRHAYPVRAMAPGGPVRVSEQVVIARLRDRIDSVVAGVATADVHLQVRDRDLLVGVVVQLVARYGVELVPAADEVRAAVGAVLDELLGPVAVEVDVATMHVHYADVTTQP